MVAPLPRRDRGRTSAESDLVEGDGEGVATLVEDAALAMDGALTEFQAQRGATRVDLADDSADATERSRREVDDITRRELGNPHSDTVVLRGSAPGQRRAAATFFAVSLAEPGFCPVTRFPSTTA